MLNGSNLLQSTARSCWWSKNQALPWLCTTWASTNVQKQPYLRCDKNSQQFGFWTPGVFGRDIWFRDSDPIRSAPQLSGIANCRLGGHHGHYHEVFWSWPRRTRFSKIYVLIPYPDIHTYPVYAVIWIYHECFPNNMQVICSDKKHKTFWQIYGNSSVLLHWQLLQKCVWFGIKGALGQPQIFYWNQQRNAGETEFREFRE